MRKIKRRKGKNKVIIITSLCLLLVLTVGYAAFQTNLTLKAKGKIIVLQDLYVASYGSDTKGNGTREKPYATIQKAYNMAGDTGSIHILDNITQKETINFDKDKEIILDSVNNNSIIRDTSGVLLNVTSGTTTLRNIIFDGNNYLSDNRMIVLSSDSYIEEGAIFKNVNYSKDVGATITINNGATVTMNGGEFVNNKTPNGGGAAIYLSNREAHLIINNGKIHDNSSKDGAIWSVGIITINNGEMYNNTASHGGGAIFNNGTLIINNGEIYNNKADFGGAIANGYYAGYDTIITIKGGKIYNNTAITYGGGIELHKSVIYTNTGGIIENNTPDNVYRVS